MATNNATRPDPVLPRIGHANVNKRPGFPIAESIDEVLEGAARIWAAFAPSGAGCVNPGDEPESYSTSANEFLHAAEAAWFRVTQP